MPFNIPSDNTAFRDRVERAREARIEQDRLQHDIVARRIAEREFEAEFQRWKAWMEWGLYLVALQILMTLERQRDDNVPSSPEDQWNDAFCEAVELIPEARRFFEEMSIVCIKAEKGRG